MSYLPFISSAFSEGRLRPTKRNARRCKQCLDIMLYYFFPFHFSLSNKSLICFTYIYNIWWYQKQSWLKRCQDQRNVLRNWVSLFVKQHCLSSWTFPGALLVMRFLFPSVFLSAKKKTKTAKAVKKKKTICKWWSRIWLRNTATNTFADEKPQE